MVIFSKGIDSVALDIERYYSLCNPIHWYSYKKVISLWSEQWTFQTLFFNERQKKKIKVEEINDVSRLLWISYLAWSNKTLKLRKSSPKWDSVYEIQCGN